MKMWKVAVCGLSKLSNAKARTDTPKCQGVHANGCCRAFTFASVLSTGLLLPACPISSNSAPPRTTITAVGHKARQPLLPEVALPSVCELPWITSQTRQLR